MRRIYDTKRIEGLRWKWITSNVPILLQIYLVREVVSLY